MHRKIFVCPCKRTFNRINDIFNMRRFQYARYAQVAAPAAQQVAAPAFQPARAARRQRRAGRRREIDFLGPELPNRVTRSNNRGGSHRMYRLFI